MKIPLSFFGDGIVFNLAFLFVSLVAVITELLGESNTSCHNAVGSDNNALIMTLFHITFLPRGTV